MGVWGQHGRPQRAAIRPVSYDDPRQLGAAEVRRRPPCDREGVEADGPGGKTVPAAAHEPQELTALHTRHSAGHLPAPQDRLRRVRGQNAGPLIRFRSGSDQRSECNIGKIEIKFRKGVLTPPLSKTPSVTSYTYCR